MPKVEKYGAQPPIEILRQWLVQGGWYDRKDTKHPFRNLQNMTLISAMGPPGGGRAYVTPRITRHFNQIGYVNLDETTLDIIFRNILKWHFREGGFSTEVAGLEQKIVKATNKVFEKIQAELKPTPAKTHYTFNLRDFSKVVCGMTASTKKELQTAS
jgi:dynein heavy chain